MKDRRRILVGTLNGVYRTAASYMKGAKNVPLRRTNQGL